MVISCHMQSGFVIHALELEPVVPKSSPRNHHIRFKILLFLGLDFRDPPAVNEFTVYCWLHIPAQRKRDPDSSKHFWTKWVISGDFLRI